MYIFKECKDGQLQYFDVSNVNPGESNTLSWVNIHIFSWNSEVTLSLLNSYYFLLFIVVLQNVPCNYRYQANRFWISIKCYFIAFQNQVDLCNYYYYGCMRYGISERSICISDFFQTTFFYLGRFLKNLAISSITKDSIYHIKHVHTKGSNYYVLYLLILRFYLVRQIFFTYPITNIHNVQFVLPWW